MAHILRLLLIAIILWTIMSLFIRKIINYLKYRFQQSNILQKYPGIRPLVYWLCNLAALILIYELTLFQGKTQIIRIPLNCDPIVLTVAIYTMYGIFISFIQFLIGYSSSNSKDIYWGKSKTKLILTESMEYRIFTSGLFKLMLLYLAVYSVTDMNKLPEFKELAESLFYVCVAVAIIEFIAFLIKGMRIGNVLFIVRENTKDSINSVIKKTFYRRYQSLFNKSIETRNQNYFIQHLFFELNNIEEFRKGEMLYSVLYEVYTWYRLEMNFQEKRLRTILNRLYTRLADTDFPYMIFNLKRINDEFWRAYDRLAFELTAENLIDIFRIQNDLLFDLIADEAKGDQEKFTTLFKAAYRKEERWGDCENYFPLTNKLWNSIQTEKHIVLLCETIRELEIMQFFQKGTGAELTYTAQLKKKVLGQYGDFIFTVLEKKKELIGQIGLEEIGYMLHLEPEVWKWSKQEPLNGNLFRKELCKTTERRIVSYFLTMPNGEFSRRLIEKLSKCLEIKYVMSFIVYRLLYTGVDRTRWKQEVCFFRQLISPREVEYTVFETANVEHVSKFIQKSNIGHRISAEQIVKFFQSTRQPLNEKNIIVCNESSYFSLARLIIFKYIFGENIIDFSAFRAVKYLNAEKKAAFIGELSNVKGVMEVDYFVRAVYAIYEFPTEYLKIELFEIKATFEMYMLVSAILEEKKLKEYLQSNIGRINDGLLQFLPIKCSQLRYRSLLSSLDSKQLQKLALHFESALVRKKQSAEEFVDELCERAEYIGSPIPEHGRQKAVQIIDALVIGEVKICPDGLTDNAGKEKYGRREKRS